MSAGTSKFPNRLVDAGALLLRPIGISSSEDPLRDRLFSVSIPSLVLMAVFFIGAY